MLKIAGIGTSLIFKSKSITITSKNFLHPAVRAKVGLK